MVLRAVPSGDEHDKDIYHAIRYAVDNDAKIINMSFGKSFSRYPEKVIEAIQYAHNHGVMIVQAAGNNGLNKDKYVSYPDKSLAGESKQSWIEVGASSSYEKYIKPTFSNYGKNSVDLFAPGYAVRTLSLDNTYKTVSGTSISAPIVSGAIALAMGIES